MKCSKRKIHGWIAAAVLLLSVPAVAQTPPTNQPTPTPVAPLPSAITTATKLFLGNAGDQDNAECLHAYNSFYAGVSALGRFQLVPDPNQADLVLEMHYEIAIGQSIGTDEGLSGRSIRQFRVVLIDPRSHTILWSLTERTNYAVREKNRDKNLEETVAALVSDFSQLATAQPPSNKSVIRH